MLPKVILIFWSILGMCNGAEEIGMPLIQISHDGVGDDYPEMREEVHLEDFFWTGSGDGPPDYLKKVHTGISKGKDVIVKTETVVATVYVDGNNEIDIPICLDCPPDDGGGMWGIIGSRPPINYTSTDRRYWLLTVMSGFYSQRDNPGLEEKLARLYRLAFTRQQSKHLGINGAQQIYGVSVPMRKDRKASEIEHTTDYELLDMTTNHTSIESQIPNSIPVNKNSELASSSSSEESEIEMSSEMPENTTNLIENTTKAPAEYVTLVSWELIQNNGKSEKAQSSGLPQQPITNQLRLQQLPFLRDDKVRVVIHNITQITADDVQKGKVAGIYDEDVNERIEERPVANQTELIYSVFVNGRPVLAVAAANDMKLVTETEVVNAIGKHVIMKAEPYLREPQATPLAPATRSGSDGLIASFQNNTALVIVSSVAILLLLLLLLSLLLMGRSRAQQKNNDAKRSSSQNDLLSESQSARPESSITAVDTNISTARSRDIGVQNLSFDQERAQDTTTSRDRNEYAYSPIRDPAAMRNHYEGLLEGAMQMYSSQDDLPMPLPTRDFTNNRRQAKREFRGSSAGASGYTPSKPYQTCGRPATALAMSTPKSNQSTQPSSPTSGAWGGSIHGSYSSVVRPLSAGPAQQSEFGVFRGLPKLRRDSGDLDAAPLVRALQQELQKYKKGNE